MGETRSHHRVVVSDAGPIIHLDELGCLGVLSDFAEVLIPQSVWNEIHRHRPGALLTAEAMLHVSAVAGNVPVSVHVLTLRFALHRGELEALQLAVEQHADLILTDDSAARSAARLAAESLGIPRHGTVGLILRDFRQGRRSRAETIQTFRRIPIQSTLHIKQSLLDEIIRRTQAEPENDLDFP